MQKEKDGLTGQKSTENCSTTRETRERPSHSHTAHPSQRATIPHATDTHQGSGSPWLRPQGTHQTKKRIRVTFRSWGCLNRSRAFPEGPVFSGTNWEEDVE